MTCPDRMIDECLDYEIPYRNCGGNHVIDESDEAPLDPRKSRRFLKVAFHSGPFGLLADLPTD